MMLYTLRLPENNKKQNKKPLKQTKNKTTHTKTPPKISESSIHKPLDHINSDNNT